MIDIRELTGRTDAQLSTVAFRLTYGELLNVLMALDKAMDLLCKSNPTDEVHALIHECARVTVVLTERIMAQISDDHG